MIKGKIASNAANLKQSKSRIICVFALMAPKADKCEVLAPELKTRITEWCERHVGGKTGLESLWQILEDIAKMNKNGVNFKISEDKNDGRSIYPLHLTITANDRPFLSMESSGYSWWHLGNFPEASSGSGSTAMPDNSGICLKDYLINEVAPGLINFKEEK